MAFLCWVFAAFCGAVALGKNLANCPDCEASVSARAVSCPYCGCPGEFIAAAVRRQEEEKKPKAVVRVKTGGAGGFAVAVEEDGSRYVVLPVTAAGSADSLTLETIQGVDLPYSHLEVAKEVSLIRFRAESDLLAYLRRSTAQDGKPAMFLDESGSALAAGPVASAGRVVARLGTDGGVMAINAGRKFGEQWIALNQPIEWTVVEPSRFREQAGLLARLALRKPSEPIAAADRTTLEKADWVCRDFRERAQALLNTGNSVPRKSP